MSPPGTLAFDELRVHGFVEGQNLAIIPGGFQAGNEQIDDCTRDRLHTRSQGPSLRQHYPASTVV
jgi:hypothetical protein